MQIFAERDLQEFLGQRRDEAKLALSGLDDQTVLASAPDVVADYQIQQFLVSRLRLRCSDAVGEIVRKQIRAEDFPRGRGITVWSGKTYPKQAMVYRVPFEGNRALLNYGYLRYLPWTMKADVVGSDIVFEIVAFSDDLQQVDQEASALIKELANCAERYDGEVASFNDSLKRDARGWVAQRRKEAEQNAAALPLLKIPVRRVPASDMPPTLAVPVAKKQVVVAPATEPASPTQEWFLGDDLYETILQLVHDWGVVMERHPSTYVGKDEEALRDLFILLLAPHFDYSGGETFNKQGKTDILIRHEKANVFVAECKVWRGKEQLSHALDQLLGYLTWRDSKAALIVFVRNQDIENVRRQIEPILQSHRCFVALTTRREGWTDAQLRLAQASDRVAKCAVLLFHMPE